MRIVQFASLPFRHQLTWLVLGVTLLTLLVAGSLMLALDRQHAQENLERDLQSVAILMANRSVAALVFQDEATARENLTALGNILHVAQACLFDVDGRVFARFGRAGLTHQECIAADSLEHIALVNASRVKVQAPVRNDSDVIGALQIITVPDPLAQQLNAQLLALLAILGAALGVALAVAPRMSRRLVQPLVQMQKVSKDVIASSDFGLRAPEFGPNEVGDLARGFNAMLDVVQVAQRSLAERETYARRLFHDSPIPQLLLDRTTNFYVDCNVAAALSHGYTRPEDLIGKSPVDVAAPRQRDEQTFAETFDGNYDRVDRDGRITMEWRYRRPDGTEWDGEVTVIGFVVEGQRLYHVAIQDITARKRAEESLRELNSQLEEKVDARTRELQIAMTELERSAQVANAATRTKSEFLANMSHEIRTPMNAIIGMTELTLRTELDSRQRNFLTKSKVAAHTLLELINEILDFSKIEAGKLELEDLDYSLADVLERVTGMIGVRAADKHLEFRVEVDRAVPPILIGDSLRLSQVLLNLCTNAVKFTAAGEIALKVAPAELPGGGSGLIFSVRDTGIGMDDAQIGRLFVAFNQADNSTTRQYGGTGLGLAISKRLVELMGGEIGVRSQPGAGSEFYFTLPLRAGNEKVGAGATALDRLHLRILVIDDSSDAREILVGMLRGMGHEAMALASAAEGLAHLERAHGSVDVLLIDWKMPGLDGMEACATIRAMPEKYGTPKLVIITAYGAGAAQSRLMEAPVDAIVGKPLSASTLLDTLVNLTSITRTRGPDGKEGLPAPSLEGLHVLLVEDNEFNQEVASEMLGLAGVQVRLAGNGQLALTMLAQAGERWADLVLMDIQMPVMDGLEATRRLRAQACFDDLPIIAMTAHAMQRDRDECAAIGMNDFVTKPFEPNGLYQTLAKWDTRGSARAEKSRSVVAETPSIAAPNEMPIDTEIVTTDSDLPGIEREKGLKYCMNREETFERFLRLFVKIHGASATVVRSACLAGDLDGARRRAHSLKSSAATIGADDLADTARAVESTLTGIIEAGGDMAEAAWSACVATMERELTIVCDGIVAHDEKTRDAS